MAIERDPSGIKFHELGTLTSVTRWIRTHDEGIAEWLKNARRAYQPDRANLDESHRVAVLLLKDEDTNGPARIALLDAGGANLDDVTAWSVWQDPAASVRGSLMPEEETHGNGGKAYRRRARVFTFDIHADSEVDTHVILSKQSRQSVTIRFSVGSCRSIRDSRREVPQRTDSV